jgi:hypothetical protein
MRWTVLDLLPTMMYSGLSGERTSEWMEVSSVMCRPAPLGEKKRRQSVVLASHTRTVPSLLPEMI